MKISCSLLVGMLAALSLFAPVATAQTGQPPPLDYSRIIREPGMVFVPYQGMNRGPIYYTEYEQVPTATATVGGLRRLFVNLQPTAHLQNLYNDFLRRHAITDAQVRPALPEVACKPTEQIKALLREMPEGYRPRILGSGYPTACMLSIYFLPEREAEVRNFIASAPVIEMDVSVPLCAANSPRLDVQRIVNELRAREVLTPTDTGDVTGNMWDVLRGSTLLSQQNPALFGTPDPQDGWRVLIKQFLLDPVHQTVTMPSSKVASSILICAPEPLEIRF